MKTTHQLIFQDARDMARIPAETIDLVVTSPPYPMIEMWDDLFASLNPEIRKALETGNGLAAFEQMHRELDRVWNETYRLLKPGSILCINIGDATRTISGNFGLYPNHARIVNHLLQTGFTPLPEILWRKQTNAPNKFMGSGMLPAGAYVTLEHEFILVLRKGGKREFKTPADKQNRRESALFWEERNVWYSDVWMDLKGISQKLSDEKLRRRSGAFPSEVPYRLISMFSAKGDVVLDPFLGMGTTLFAAMSACRNSIGIELDANFRDPIVSELDRIVPFSDKRIKARLAGHENFVKTHSGAFKYMNRHYDFPVKTRQEQELFLNPLCSVRKISENEAEVTYSSSQMN